MILSATGPAGSVPHPAYCTPQCYTKGTRDRSGSCRCKGCGGKAHGRGKKYAFDHGYLKYPLGGPSRPQPDQESLFPEEISAPVNLADPP